MTVASRDITLNGEYDYEWNKNPRIISRMTLRKKVDGEIVKGTFPRKRNIEIDFVTGGD